MNDNNKGGGLADESRGKTVTESSAGANSNASKEYEARVDSIIDYCSYSVKKTELFSNAMLQIVSICLILVLAFVNVPPAPSLTRFETERLVSRSEASEVTTAAGSVDWYRSALVSLYQLRLSNSSTSVAAGSVPFAMSTLKLYNPFLSSEADLTAADSCRLPKQLAGIPFAQGLAGSVNRDICRSRAQRNMTSFYGEFHFQSDQDVASGMQRLSNISTLLSRSSGSAPSSESSSTSLANYLSDTNVEAVFLFYSRGRDMYVTVRAEFDTKHSKLTVLSTAIRLIRVDTAVGVVKVVVDLLYALHCLFVIAYFLKEQRLYRKLEGDWAAVFSFKSGYDIVFIALSVWSVVVFSLFFAHSEKMRKLEYANASSQETYNTVLELSSARRSLELVLGWCVLLALLRPLFYLQYLSRFSAVSETIVSSVPALTGCGLVFILIVVTFAVCGHQLFGHEMEEFQSIPSTITFLFLLVFREGSLDYQPYLKMAPGSAVVYFLLFAFLTQIVVLNIVVGVIAAAFSASIATMELVRAPTWTLRGIAKDIRSIFMRFGTYVRILKRSGTDATPSKPSTTNESRSIGSGSEDTRKEKSSSPISIAPKSKSVLMYTYERLCILDALREQKLKKDTLLSEASVARLVPQVSREVVHRVVRKASYHIGTVDAVTRQSRTTIQRMSLTERMEQQLRQQVTTVGELYRVLLASKGHVDVDVKGNPTIASATSSAGVEEAKAKTAGTTGRVENPSAPSSPTLLPRTISGQTEEESNSGSAPPTARAVVVESEPTGLSTLASVASHVGIFPEVPPEHQLVLQSMDSVLRALGEVQSKVRQFDPVLQSMDRELKEMEGQQM